MAFPILLLLTGCGSLLGFDDVTLATGDGGPEPEFDAGPDPALCGNANDDPGETCDDGNTTSGDGCSARCLDETLFCSPSAVGTEYSIGSSAGRMIAEGNYLYVAGSENALNPTMRILDVSNPATVSEVGSFQHDAEDRPNARTFDILKRGDFLWLTGEEPGIISLNVSDVANPSLGALRLNPGTDGHAVLLGADHLLASTSVSERPTAYDISSNTGLSFTAAIGNSSVVYFAVGASDTLAFGASGDIIHISDSVDDPANSQVIGTYTHSASFATDTRRIVATDTVLAIAVDGVSAPGVHLVDISIPSGPNFGMTIPGSPRDLALAGNFLYIPDNDGLQVYDIRNAASPVLAGGVVDFEFFSESVAVDPATGRAYLMGEGNLKIIEGLPGLCNAVCGNNQREYPEECDDGNGEDGDGCDSDCTNSP